VGKSVVDPRAARIIGIGELDAGRQGSRDDVTVSARPAMRAVMEAAPAPLAESTTIASRCSAVVGSESTRGTSGLNQTTDAAPSASALCCVHQLTVSR
jgi:hypothetical protein